MTRHDLTIAREFEAALAWWQAAGVDCDFADDVTVWLADAPLTDPRAGAAGAAGARSGAAAAPPQSAETRPPHRVAPIASAPEPAAVPRRDLLGDSPPADLAAFRAWWMEADGLSPSTSFARVPPRGSAGAALMVLVPAPEPGDGETLLSGPQGRLLANILAAMGWDDSQAYIAAALPCHMPMADLGAIAAGGMDAVTAHHVSLVAPQRLVAFGAGLGTMLGSGLGANDTSPDHPLREINHAGRKTPAMLSETLDAMMDMPRLKARFWRRWIEWSATV